MKRKLMLGLLSAVGGLTIIGSGFSAWYFDGAEVKADSNIGVTVTNVASEFGAITATDVPGLTLYLDQGGFAQKTNHDAGITFATPTPDLSSLSGATTYNGEFDATYSIEALKSQNAKNAGLKATFKATVTLKEAAAKYLTFQTSFTNADGYTVPTYTAGSDVTFTLTQDVEFTGENQTFKFEFNLKTETSLKNNAFKYTENMKPQNKTDLETMRAAVNAHHKSILTFNYSLEVAAK